MAKTIQVEVDSAVTQIVITRDADGAVHALASYGVTDPTRTIPARLGELPLDAIEEKIRAELETLWAVAEDQVAAREGTGPRTRAEAPGVGVGGAGR